MKLAGEILGAKNNRGPLVVIAHGAMGSRESDDATGLPDWRLCADWAPLFRYDALGHGQSPISEKAEDYTWSNQGKLLQQELHNLTPTLTSNGMVMVGSSMGVGSVLHAVLSQPDPTINYSTSQVKFLILTIPPTSWESRDPTREAMNIWAEKVETSGVEAFWEYLCSFPPTPFMVSALPEYRDIVGPFIKRMSQLALAKLFKAAALSDLPSRSDLSKIDIPTLILCRTGDRLHPTSMGEELNALIPNSSLVISESGHQVEQWPELVREFIKA